MKKCIKSVPILVLSLLLASCSASNKDSAPKDTDSKLIKKEVTVDSNNLSDVYGKQVNLSDLIGMPQINNDQSSQLLSMISGKEDEYRTIMEKEIIDKNLSFEEVCLGLNGVLCEINNEIYKGTRFGLSLYSKVSKKDMMSNKTADLAMRTWSVNWIKYSLEKAKEVDKTCSAKKEEEYAGCVNENSENPIVAIYANALNQDNTKLMEEYLRVKLLIPSAKKYLFDLGFLSGYSIGYDIDNKATFVDKYKGKKVSVSAQTSSEKPKKTTPSVRSNEPKVSAVKNSVKPKERTSKLPTPKIEVQKPSTPVVKKEEMKENNVESKIDDLINSVNK